jgi:hypothetical protein
MSTRIATVAVILLASLASTGCGVGGIAPAGVFIEYSRGGVAAPDYLVIKQDHRATLVRGEAERQFVLGEDAFGRLQDAVGAVGFEDLAPEYPEGGRGCGGNCGQWYQIAYRGHTVWMLGTAVPERLRPIVDILNRVIDDQGGAGNVLHTGTPNGG